MTIRAHLQRVTNIQISNGQFEKVILRIRGKESKRFFLNQQKK